MKLFGLKVLSGDEDVKELREAAVGFLEFAVIGAYIAHGGFDAGDLDRAKEAYEDPARNAKIKAAIDRVEEAPAEALDISWGELFEIVTAISPYPTDILRTYKEGVLPEDKA